MRSIERFIVTVCRVGLGLAFLTLIVVVMIQVLGRLLDSSPIWTEELTRYALLYMCAFGAGLAWRSGDLVNVDLLCESLPGAWPVRLRLIAAALTSLMCLWLLLPAWKFVSIGAMQTSPAMAVRMNYIHLSVFVLIATLFVFSLLRALFILLVHDDGLATNRKPDTREVV